MPIPKRRKLSISRQVAALVQARKPVWLVGNEELRMERCVLGVCKALKMDLGIWRMSTGLLDAGRSKEIASALNDPNRLLPWVIQSTDRRLYLFKDIVGRLGNEMVLGFLKDLVFQLPTLEPASAKAIVVLDAEPPPDAARKLFKVIDFPLPNKAVLGKLVDDVAVAVSDEQRAWIEASRDAIVDAMRGLEAEEASVQLKLALVESNGDEPDVATIAEAKKDKLSSDGVIRWVDPDPRGMGAIGGLDQLKDWLYERKTAMGEAAREWNLMPPKGILIIGIPGGGKSLTAKCVATAYKLPLLRFITSAVFGKYVGDSERNMREAIKTSRAVAPGILWIDELDKGFSSGDGDAGVSRRVLGDFMSEAQDGLGCFIVATANDVTVLKDQFPELFRAGRFDAIFYVGVPTKTERKAIIKVMKGKIAHCQDVEAEVQVDHPKDEGCQLTLLEATEQFTGAEIEQAFIAGQTIAWNDGAREVTTRDVVLGTLGVTPIVKQSAKKINEMREAVPGAIPASAPEEVKDGVVDRTMLGV